MDFAEGDKKSSVLSSGRTFKPSVVALLLLVRNRIIKVIPVV